MKQAGIGQAGIGLIIGGVAALILILKPKAARAAGMEDAVIATGNLESPEYLAFAARLPSRARKSRFGDLAPVFWRLAVETGEDPYLLAAIASREAQFGALLDSAAKGDYGNGHGLWQLDKRFHAAFIARTDARGNPLWLDPYQSGLYAIKHVLQPAREKFMARPSTPTVSVSAAEAKRFGEASQATIVPGVYGDNRPYKGDLLVSATLAAYNASWVNVLKATESGAGPDAATTGGDYSRDVLRRRAEMMQTQVAWS